MDFTPEIAGIVAQILAVLLLATAFAPTIRGSMSKEWITDTQGRRHLVPTRRAQSRGAYGRAIYITSLIVVIVIALDTLILMNGVAISDYWRLIPIGINTIALGALVTTTIRSVRDHVEDDPSGQSGN